jgi:PPIC-type peptidyl-prolyl cis-trans isomerase-like protein
VIAFSIGDSTVNWFDVIQHAKLHGNLEFAKDARRALLIADECCRRNIQETQEELQQSANKIRQRRGLFSAQDTQQWLAENHLNIEDLEQLAREDCRRSKLIKDLTDGELERVFLEQPSLLTFYELSVIAVEDEGIARELLSIIESGEETFADIARKYSVDRNSRERDGRLLPICGADLPPHLAEAIATRGEAVVLGPFLHQSWEIYRVEGVHRPARDERSIQAARRVLFGRWLSAREAQSPFPWEMTRDTGAETA